MLKLSLLILEEAYVIYYIKEQRIHLFFIIKLYNKIQITALIIIISYTLSLKFIAETKQYVLNLRLRLFPLEDRYPSTKTIDLILVKTPP